VVNSAFTGKHRRYGRAQHLFKLDDTEQWYGIVHHGLYNIWTRSACAWLEMVLPCEDDNGITINRRLHASIYRSLTHSHVAPGLISFLRRFVVLSSRDAVTLRML
jgi:hypothetical protein